MKMTFVFGKVVWIFTCTNVIQSTARYLPGPLRITTRHFTPYMYQDTNGTFYDGMEFRLLQKMAEMLNVSLRFQATSNHSDICCDVATNVSDICIGGIFPTEDILKYTSTSVTYASDDLTWCVRKADMMPMLWAQMLFFSPTTWFMIIFGYGYLSGILLYLLVQFDLKYKRRNNFDWHHSNWLVALPAVIGQAPNFQPLKGTVRIFFAFLLTTAFFLFQIIYTQADIFLHTQKPWHQVSSFAEIMDEKFDLVGSREMFNLLNQNEMIPARKSESFNICEGVSDCFAYAQNLKYVAIGGSRENIINSQWNFSSEMFCFDSFESIATYPIAMYMRRDFPLKEKVNEIVKLLLESGFFVKWQIDCQPKRNHESETGPLPLTVTHISVAMVVVIGFGSMLSTLTFLAENVIYWKKKQQRGNRHNIWIYLEKFFVGRRICFKNVPERLQEQNKNFDPPFPWISEAVRVNEELTKATGAEDT